MLYYPAIVNGVLLVVFGGSVLYPPTVVERIARLREGALPAEAVRYTRRVTIAWVVFFVSNGGIALYTACFAALGYVGAVQRLHCISHDGRDVRGRILDPAARARSTARMSRVSGTGRPCTRIPITS